MASKLVKCPENLYTRAVALSRERSVSIGAALELMCSGVNPREYTPSTLEVTDRKPLGKANQSSTEEVKTTSVNQGQQRVSLRIPERPAVPPGLVHRARTKITSR
jgi:hypothetical protein